MVNVTVFVPCVGCKACKNRTWGQGGVEAVDGHGGGIEVGTGGILK